MAFVTMQRRLRHGAIVAATSENATRPAALRRLCRDFSADPYPEQP
jgi:hypothetical protein